MKKILINTALIIGAFVSVNAQSSNVTNAIMTYKEGAKSYAEAKKYIDLAVVNPKTSIKSKTWYWSGQINHSLAVQTEDLELFKVAMASYNKSIELNEEASMVELSKKNNAAMFNDMANIGIAKHQKEDVEGAMAFYTECLAIKPADTLIIGNATIAAFALKQYDKVIEINTNWKTLENASETPFTNIIKANVMKGDKEAALKSCEEALVKYPTNKKILTEKSNALISLKRAPEAIASLEKMIEVDPNNAIAYTILGTIYFEQKENVKAVSQFQKALEINPDIEDANYNLGSYYFNLAAEKFNKVNDMTLAQYNSTGKKMEADAKSLMMKSIPYFEKVNELVDKDDSRKFDPETVKSLITAYQKVGRQADSDRMSKILYGEE